MDTLFPDESGSCNQYDTHCYKDNKATALEIPFSQNTSHILDLVLRTFADRDTAFAFTKKEEIWLQARSRQ